jgi:CO/xanthine dehydrogenase Mo-binding subunit
MNVPVKNPRFSRRAILKGGALTVGFALTGLPAHAVAQDAVAAPRALDPKEVDSFLAVNGDGTVTLFCGKVDLGQGLRISIPQIAAEELGIGVDKIKFVEGDTALTPDQGRTSGSTGIQRGGMQIRQAAATARKALIDLAAERLNAKPEDLVATGGEVRRKAGGTGMSFANLIAGRQFDLKLDPKAPLKDPASYTIVGKPLARPDVPAKCFGTHVYMHDFAVPDMLHARVIRPAAVGAKLVSVDESSIKDLPSAKVVRVKDLLAVIADDEWSAIRASRALRAQWSEGTGLPAQADLAAALRADPGIIDETLVNKGVPAAQRPDGAGITATYYGRCRATHRSPVLRSPMWRRRGDGVTARGTHGNQTTFARFIGLPKDKVRRLSRGSGYGMNGHEDAAADAAILSRATGRPVRVQWTREDELGWDPKGPPQLIAISGAVASDGRILDWRTELWIPKTTRGLPNIPLLAPEAAGLDHVPGLNPGLISQNGDPPYAAESIQVIAHWLKDAPLRPAPIRSPGKPANCFAVESFVDELAAAIGADPVEFRLRGLKDPRAIEVIKRTAALMNWQVRPHQVASANNGVARGRGISFVHYKHSETYVGMGMEVAVDRASGQIAVERVACAHDCGQIINPDGVRAQVEGSILQTISRVLMEEVMFDRSRVVSVDWASYPILRFSGVPKINIELINRPTEQPVGAGEAACTAVGAALANAVHDATGTRLRTVPFMPERVKAALIGKA